MNQRTEPRGYSDWSLAARLLAATGFAALGHEVLWTRRMMDLLGAGAEANSRVFVCFFVGLSLGAALASSLIPRIHRPWRALAVIEFAVGLTSLPMATLPYWSDWIWPAVGPERLVSATGLMIKTVCSVAMVLPPAAFMGLTLPLMVSAALPRTGPTNRRAAVWLYAMNTAGGAAAVVFVAAFGLERLGVTGSMLLCVLTNWLVAARCYRRATERQEAAPADAGSPTQRASPPFGSNSLPAAGFAFLSGAGLLAIEVLVLQLMDLSVPLSFYPPAALLFCVIALLAIASALTPRLLASLRSHTHVIPLAAAGTGLLVTIVPIAFFSLTGGRSTDFAFSASFAGFLFKIVGITLIAVGPALLLAGTIFPNCLCSVGGEQERDQQVGRQVGSLVAVNGIGGLVGAELARSYLLPTFGVHMGLGVVGVVYASVALFTLRTNEWKRSAVAWGCVLSALVITLGWLPSQPLFYWSGAYRVVETRSSREGVLTVFESPRFGRALSFNNQYLLGSVGAGPDEARQAHIPLLLHPAPERVAFAGLATGITASGALQHDAVKSITVVELSSLVMAAASKHFGPYNDNLAEQPKVRIYREDARTYLTACIDRFDAVIGDLFTPWRPGEAGLCSREYFLAARRALRPGGVFCQWFPMHQLTEEQFNVIFATFQTVFPRVHLFRNNLKTGSIPLGLIGFRDRELDWDIVSQRCLAERTQGRLGDPLVRHPEGLAMLYLGTVAGAPLGGELNTLANLRIEIGAGRELMVMRPGKYCSYEEDGNPWPGFLLQRVEHVHAEPSFPKAYRELPATGLTGTRLDLAARRGLAATNQLADELRRAFPKHLLSDSGSRWDLWAGEAASQAALKPAPALPHR